MSKKVYTILSPHMINDSRGAMESIKGVVDDETLEVRLNLIEALAKTIGSGAFFCDMVCDEKEASAANDYLRSSESCQTLRKIIEEVYTRKVYADYESLRELELFKRLRLQGYNFEYRTTERKFPGGIIKELVSRIFNGFSYRLTKEGVRVRDDIVISNIIKYGMDENILFMGSAHKLKNLRSSGLEWYKVRVYCGLQGKLYQKLHGDLPKHVQVHGSLPSRFEKMISESVNEKVLGFPIIKHIEYV